MADVSEMQKLAKTGRIAWHSFPLGDVFARLGSKSSGISEKEAKIRLNRFGRNIFYNKDKVSLLRIIFDVFWNPFFAIAVFSSLTALFAKMYSESLLIFLISMFGFLILFLQKAYIQKYINKIKSFDVRKATVIRDGVQKRVLFSEVVPGDIIVFSSGDEIPADARIIQGFGIKADEREINGTMESVSKSVSHVYENFSNIVFGGSFISEGFGEAVVFGTGEDLEIFNRSKIKHDKTPKETYIEKKILRLGKFLLFFIIIFSFLILSFCFLFGKDSEKPLYFISTFSAIFVLPVFYISVFFSIFFGIVAMLKSNCLLKSIFSAEKIGDIDVLVSDKPGIFGFRECKIEKILFPEIKNGVFGLVENTKDIDNNLLVVSYGALSQELSCEPIHFLKEKGNFEGDAFVKSVVSFGIDIKDIEKKFKKIGGIFNIGQSKISIYFRETQSGDRFVFITGYADFLLNNIKRIQFLNRYENAAKFELDTIKDSYEDLTKKGLFVFAVCSKKISREENINNLFTDDSILKLLRDINLVGIVGIKYLLPDNLRILVSDLRVSGTKILLSTCDSQISAKLFGIESGVLHKNKMPDILDGKETEVFNSKELSERSNLVDILCRSKFSNKLKLIKSWIENNKIVGFFGDSQKDYLILSESSLGVSSINSLDSVKNFSEVILLDGKFETFLKAVRIGKNILNNIRGSIIYLTSIIITEVSIVFLGIFFGFPVFASHIIWINIVTVILAIFAISTKKDTSEIINANSFVARKRFLERRSSLVAIYIGLANSICVFSIFLFFKSILNSLDYARAMTFLSLCVNSLFIAFSCSTLKNQVWKASLKESKNTVFLLISGLLISLLAIANPFYNYMNSSWYGFLEIVIILGVGTIVFLSTEIFKWIIAKSSKYQITNNK